MCWRFYIAEHFQNPAQQCVRGNGTEVKYPRASLGLAMLAAHPAHRAGTGAHDDAFGGHQPAALALNAFEQRSVVHARRREYSFALGDFLKVIDIV